MELFITCFLCNAGSAAKIAAYILPPYRIARRNTEVSGGRCVAVWRAGAASAAASGSERRRTPGRKWSASGAALVCRCPASGRACRPLRRPTRRGVVRRNVAAREGGSEPPVKSPVGREVRVPGCLMNGGSRPLGSRRCALAEWRFSAFTSRVDGRSPIAGRSPYGRLWRRRIGGRMALSLGALLCDGAPNVLPHNWATGVRVQSFGIFTTNKAILIQTDVVRFFVVAVVHLIVRKRHK